MTIGASSVTPKRGSARGCARLVIDDVRRHQHAVADRDAAARADVRELADVDVVAEPKLFGVIDDDRPAQPHVRADGRALPEDRRGLVGVRPPQRCSTSAARGDSASYRRQPPDDEVRDALMSRTAQMNGVGRRAEFHRRQPPQ